MSQPANTFHRIKLLHVDDEKLQLESFEDLMQIYDPLIEVTSISSPLEALEILKKEHYDCIITDFKMPEINGIEFSIKIRAYNSKPIILYTGQGSEEVAEAAFRAGINDYIKKDIDPSHYHLLAKRIRDVVAKSQKEDLYLKVVEESREAIAIIADNTIVYANNALIGLLGAKNSTEIIGRKLYDFILPQDRYQVENNIASISKSGEFSNYYRIILRRRDGKKTATEISVSTINYLGKKAILNFIRDISERKLLEEEIKSSEERFRTLVNMNPDGIALLDTSGAITWINPMFSRILGYPEKEILGKSFFSISSNKASTYLKNIELFHNLQQGLLIPFYEFQWKRKDKEMVWIEAHLRLIELNTNGQEFMVIIRDINQHKIIKEALEKSSKKLEKLVQDKTSTLVTSEKMIAAGQLTYVVANDIRTPLVAIKNAVNYIRSHPEEKQAYLKKINESISSSVTMLDDMRTKTKDKPLELEEISIKHLITDIINENPTPPSIKMNMDLEDMLVKVDIKMMRRVLLNLVQNAIEASKYRGNISISSKNLGDTMQITIEDAGRGISPENMKKIFKPFFTTKPDGLGLSLSYCKRAIESHKGQINIKSILNKGTTVCIQIPVAGLEINVHQKISQ